MKITTVPVDMGTDLKPFSGECKHEDFFCSCEVSRVCHEPNQNPHTFDLEVKVICSQCGERMRFRGTKHAISFHEPTGDVFALELRAPMEPSGDHFDYQMLDAAKAWR